MIPGKRSVMITHPALAKLYGDQFSLPIITFPAGEVHKTRKTKETIEDQLLEQGYGRDTCLIALGGGVVSDIVGFVAATYCRGIPYIIIPTTLLSMVDASIGGKTAVNTPHGKNMIGAFHPPEKTIINLDFLKTLPKKELLNGFVEMIKHGLIADKNHFTFLLKNADKLLSLNIPLLQEAINQSRMIKERIVSEDAFEKGKRTLLNFGHTIGHALELTTNYALSHGEAVAIGLITEGYISQTLTPFSSLKLIQKILTAYEIPSSVSSVISVVKIQKAMQLDKKALNQTPRFVLLNEIGSCETFGQHYCTPVDQKLVSEALSNASTLTRSSSTVVDSSK